MTLNNIEVWLRIRDRARFSREARAAARDIDNIGDAANRVSDPLKKMGGALSQLAGDAGVSTSRTRLFGFAIGTVLTVAVALIPVIVGLGGAITALAGSLGAATVGAGLLALALGGPLVAGLGAVGLVAFDAIKNFGEVNQRFQTWRAAVAGFGRDSTQAATAFRRLQGIIKTSGGVEIFKAVEAWRELRDEFESKMSPVLGMLAKGMTTVFSTISQILPVLAAFGTRIANALMPILQGFLNLISSPIFAFALDNMAGTFERISGPIGRGIINIFEGLLSIITRMSPFTGGVADGFERMTESFQRWAVTTNFKPFIDQLSSWWGLLKAVGALLITILGGGAKAGQGMVDSLTHVLEGWNAFLKGPVGRPKMLEFFSNATAMTSALAGFLAHLTAILFKFGNALLPHYTKFFKGAISIGHDFIEALRPAAPFFQNVLGPILKGLAKGVIGSVIGALKIMIFVLKLIAPVLGFVGKAAAPLKGIFEVLGTVLGFVFGGAILKLIGMLGKVSVVLKPIAWLARVTAIPIRLVGAAFGFVFTKVLQLVGFFGRIGGMFFSPLRDAWNRILGFMTGVALRFYDAGAKLWHMLRKGFFQAIGAGLGFAGDIAKAVWNFIAGTFNRFLPNNIGPINLPNNPLPMLASGGVVSGSGSWISGEAGPELNTMMNGRVHVQPLPAVAAQGTDASLSGSGGGKRVLISKVYLKGRQIAEAVADEAEDDRARW